MTKDEQARRFDACLVQAGRSAAFSRFCEKAYGMALGQFSTCDMEQLERMLEGLALRPDENVLDVGCGLGMVAEYISDRTGARVTGVDYAPRAIEEAARRTHSKANRLRFETGDMETMALPERTFEAVVAIDTLYFAADLPTLIGRLKAALKPAGRMAIFHSQMAAPGADTGPLAPDRTPVATALRAQRFEYTSGDLTENDIAFWRRSREVAEQMQLEFEAEGSATLCKGRIAEGAAVLDLAAAGNFRRYLYLARLRGRPE